MGTGAAYEVGGVEWKGEPKLALDSEGRENKERKKERRMSFEKEKLV